jgi:hypothetical protein
MQPIDDNHYSARAQWTNQSVCVCRAGHNYDSGEGIRSKDTHLVYCR